MAGALPVDRRPSRRLLWRGAPGRLEAQVDWAASGVLSCGLCGRLAARIIHGVLEEHKALGTHGTVLGGSKGQDVNTRLPRHLCGGAAKVLQGVAKSRAVHVHQHAMLLGDRCDLAHLGEGIDRAVLSGLGDGDGGGLTLVDHRTDVRQEFRQMLCQLILG